MSWQIHFDELKLYIADRKTMVKNYKYNTINSSIDTFFVSQDRATMSDDQLLQWDELMGNLVKTKDGRRYYQISILRHYGNPNLCQGRWRKDNVKHLFL